MDTSLDGILRSLRQLEQSSAVDEFVDGSLDVLWGMVPCVSLGFNELDEREQRVLLYRSREPGWEEMPDELFWSHAEEFPICSGLAPGSPGVMRSQDVISTRALRDSRLYAEILHPFGIEYEMKIAFASQPWVSRASCSLGMIARSPIGSSSSLGSLPRTSRRCTGVYEGLPSSPPASSR
ncbi:MAG: hypothetical protein WD556_07190 [Actinomycetota bacterium]